jgi:phosphoserine phosphatase RsbU/P
LAAFLRSTIKAYAYRDVSPADIITWTNDVFTRTSAGPVFATALLGMVDVQTGSFTYCSAGHPPALLRRADGRCELLQCQSPVIGAFPKKGYRQATAQIGPGDFLLLYTDGVTEARRNGELFREERLARVLCTASVDSARELPEEIFAALVRFTGGVLLDDVALLALSLSRP